MNIAIETLRALEAAGVRFIIAIPGESGTPDELFYAEDVLLFLADEEALFAKQHGVTKQQYRDWTESNYCVRCSSFTKKGRRCKNLVAGGFLVSAIRWLELEGGYCDLHEG